MLSCYCSAVEELLGTKRRDDGAEDGSRKLRKRAQQCYSAVWTSAGEIQQL